jgi:hypothetical protein
MVDREVVRQGTSRPALAHQWGVTTSVLNNEGRLRLLFKGDAATHQGARDASNAYEHGEPDFGAINMRSERCRDTTIGYLREALVGILDRLDAPTRTKLLTPPLTVPPVPGGFIGLTGDLPTDFDFEKGATVNFMPFALTRKPSKVEIDNNTGSYTVTMEMNTRAQMDNAQINVDGSYAIQGTNLVSHPKVSSVTRAEPSS